MKKKFRCPVCLDEMEECSCSTIENIGIPNCRNCDREMIPYGQLLGDVYVDKLVRQSITRAYKALNNLPENVRQSRNIMIAKVSLEDAISGIRNLGIKA